MNIADKLKSISDPNINLFEKDIDGNFKAGNFVGRPFYLDYQRLHMLVCDSWKFKAGGIPQGCFLLAFYKNEPEKVSEALLLRVLRPSKLPTDSAITSSMIEYYKDDIETTGANTKLDSFTKFEFSFSGLECRVLGTFYSDKNGKLKFGADVENFYSAHNYEVYKPSPEILKYIVNFKEVQSNSFQIGKVRYSSTRRFQDSHEDVIVNVLPEDFLGKRTAMFGMTRTGKSNTIKKIIQSTCNMSDKAKGKLGVSSSGDDTKSFDMHGFPMYPVGQIIFDINGEYANTNLQDAGTAISEIYQDRTIRYSIIDKTSEGFKVMKVNFYKDIEAGFELIKNYLKDSGVNYISSFLSIDLSKPEDYDTERGVKIRYDRKKAAYLCCLKQAGFKLPDSLNKITFEGKSELNNLSDVNPGNGVTFDDAIRWFEAVWSEAGEAILDKYKKDKGRPLFDEDMCAIMTFLTRRSVPKGNSTISGYRKLNAIRDQHTEKSEEPFETDIIKQLRDGKIIIIDLSQGNPDLQSLYSERICQKIFSDSMINFINSKPNNFIQFYFEEAHNLFPKKDDKDLTQIYNRIAKEGAKLNLGLIYATQEVSSISSNILKNTQNWFIAHLNNSDETRELQKYYDFSDFTDSLVQFSSMNDKGFVRMKTYSSSFIIPTQIDLFPGGD